MIWLKVLLSKRMNKKWLKVHVVTGSILILLTALLNHNNTLSTLYKAKKLWKSIIKKYLIITHETPTISILASVLLSPHSHYTSQPQHHPLNTLNDSSSYFETGEKIIMEK